MKKQIGTVALWLVTFYLAFVFVTQGWSKFDDASGWARAFAHWHFPVWFRIAIGAIELVAGLLVLWPRTAFAGASLIAAVMLGAMATHAWWGRPAQATHELLPLAIALIVAFVRGKRTFATLRPVQT